MFDRKRRQQEAEVLASMFGLVEGLRAIVGDMFVQMQDQERRLKAIEELLAVANTWKAEAEAAGKVQ